MPEIEKKTNGKPAKKSMALGLLMRQLVQQSLGVPGIQTALNSLSTIQPYIDDLERELGTVVYGRMAVDPAVNAGVNTVVSMIMADGLAWKARIEKVEDDKDLSPVERKDQEFSANALKFWNMVVDGMDVPLDLRVQQCAKASITFGHKLAEKMFAVERGAIVLKDLRPIQRGAADMVVDQYGNVVGITEGGQYALRKDPETKADKEGLAKNDDGTATFGGRPLWPIEKFSLFQHEPVDGDPRGTSILRPAYNAWYVKQTFWSGLAKGMNQLATPSLIAILSEEKEAEADYAASSAAGTPVEESFGYDELTALVGFQNGSAAVFEGGTTIQEIGGKIDVEKTFGAAFALCDSQIMLSILSQARSNLEAEHGSRADSETGKNIVDVLVMMKRRSIESTLYKLAFTVFELNFGPEFAKRYTPLPKLSAGPQEDFSKNAAAVASLYTSEFVAVDQLTALDAKLGLPARNMEKWMAEIEEKKDQAKIGMDAMAKASDPRDDETPGNDDSIEDEEGDE